MGGLAVLFLLGLYLVLTVVAIVKTKPLWAKGLVLLAALLIPTADAVYGRYKLKQMCAAEAGLKVYRVAEHVEGFMASAADDYYIKHYGYQFIEAEKSPGKYYRVSRQSKQIIREENVTPISKFKASLGDLEPMGRLYWRQKYLIEAIPNGEVLATDAQIGFRGGWAERFLAQFSDAGVGSVALCNREGFNSEKLITTILRPSGE